ncbi:MAG TPA: hypothetical protein V6C72_19180 [Chroococcales cyanobacterium]
MNNPVTIPFPEALQRSSDLLKRLEAHEAREEDKAEISELLSTNESTRGFFATLLSGPWEFAERPPQWLHESLRGSSERVGDFLVRNLAMSVASSCRHLDQGEVASYNQSVRIADRVKALAINLRLPEVDARLSDLSAAIAEELSGNATSARSAAAEFLTRRAYDHQQLRQVQKWIGMLQEDLKQPR